MSLQIYIYIKKLRHFRVILVILSIRMHSARTGTIVELELIRRFRWMAAAVVLDCTDILFNRKKNL